MKRTQRGITLLGFVVVLALVGFFAYVGMKLFPMYSEYYSVRSALKGLAAEPGIASADTARIRELFFRRLQISYAETVKPQDVTITRVPEGLRMDVNYEARKALIGNLDVVGRFQATQTFAGDGGRG
ncbi:DUF4845 domain-containing protein [Luteimonas sp. TWI1416]|uniref:DUF4845 domain-containing protein n=1 Tax=unclassified Luteimonas TaxID=2629088 RepID=UPI003209F1C9